MPIRVLIVPDKFKGTLTAEAAAHAISEGWRFVRPTDQIELLPMSDGGDGFGAVMSELVGGKKCGITTLDAAHRKIKADWWWNKLQHTAVIESARIIGLAMLPPRRFHPFDLDTTGLGRPLLALQKRDIKTCSIGIGGSATNDGGFGMARTLGWRFLDRHGVAIEKWPELLKLKRIQPPDSPSALPEITVAVDVQNPLLGVRGASRIYGPQKGLRPRDMKSADGALRRLAETYAELTGRSPHLLPGAGAAGGLGFGLVAFAGGRLLSGFETFKNHSGLVDRMRQSDLILTGEGSLDGSSLMGKGVGEIARLAERMGIPCLGIGGVVANQNQLRHWFQATLALTPDLTSMANARTQASRWLTRAAERMAANVQH